jgi:hypothetical protein
MHILRLCLPAVLFLHILSTQAHAVILPDVTGPVILTVTGLDAAEFPGGVIELDVGRLEAIGKDEIVTTTIWTEGPHRFSGVMLRDLVDFLAIEASALRLHALNDYAVEFPTEEATEEAPILAYEMDGVMMSVREKGPIWVLYPFDDGPEYRTDTTFSRSIWQLDRIDVLAQ